MYDDDSQLMLELQYQAITALYEQLQRRPTRDEVMERMTVSMVDHAQPNVFFLN